MKTITLEQASEDLIGHINYSLSSHEELSIASNNGSIIMLPQDDYNSIQETLKLLSDKKSLKALLDGHEARDSGEDIESYSLEDVFNDIQD